MKVFDFEISNNSQKIVSIAGEEEIYIRVNNVDIVIKQNDVGISIDTYPFYVVDEPINSMQCWYEDFLEQKEEV